MVYTLPLIMSAAVMSILSARLLRIVVCTAFSALLYAITWGVIITSCSYLTILAVWSGSGRRGGCIAAYGLSLNNAIISDVLTP